MLIRLTFPRRSANNAYLILQANQANDIFIDSVHLSGGRTSTKGRPKRICVVTFSIMFRAAARRDGKTSRARAHIARNHILVVIGKNGANACLVHYHPSCKTVCESWEDPQRQTVNRSCRGSCKNQKSEQGLSISRKRNVNIQEQSHQSKRYQAMRKKQTQTC